MVGNLGCKPDEKLTCVASSMVQRFAETGLPIFTGISALSRGVLKRMQNLYTSMRTSRTQNYCFE